MESIHSVKNRTTLQEALAAPAALIYKHSPACYASTRAYREVQAFAAAEPDVPVYMVDVIYDRPLSREIEATLGILHESPQAILLRFGEPVWHTSHFRITADTLRREADRLEAA